MLVSSIKFLYYAAVSDRFSLARRLLKPQPGKGVGMRDMAKWFLLLVLGLLVSLPSTASAQVSSLQPSPFVLPAGLEPAVDFWKKVFSEVSLSQLIYFDPSDMSKIYEVVEVGEDSRSNDYINGERARIAAANGVDIERVKAQRGVKERTAAGIKRSGRYISQIKQIFKDRGLPPELTYLPIVESSYDMSARSSVGALGIWQFMPRTGREYMRVNSVVDERLDPIESSRAAASYLQQAYEFLGSWPLAITSYNYGKGGMARAVAEVGSDNLVDLIEKYNHPNWAFAPKHFYAEFLAAVEIGMNLQQYFPGLELDAPVEIREVELNNNTTLAALISSSGLSREEFLGWNPALTPTSRIVPAGYRMKLPIDRTTPPLVTVAQVQQATRRPQAQAQVVHHRVQRGETLYDIARRYGASVENILQINGLRKAQLIKVGTTLRIPKI
jgi:membrane-bound lytic murein transglycosylase D